MARVRRWTVTCWDMVDPEENYWCPDEMRYLLMGHEVCPDTGREHFQSYVEYKKPTRFNHVVEWFSRMGTHAFAKPSKGTADQNAIYCKEDEEWFEFGEPAVTGGSKGVFAKYADLIKDGWTVKEIIQEFPCAVSQKRAVQDLYDIVHEDDDDWRERVPPKVYWFWGPTGTGKTTEALRMCEKKPFRYVSTDGTWFDKYTDQKYALFDDFRDSIPFGFFLQLLDQHPCEVSRRCISPAEWKPEVIIITSPFHPSQHYQGVAENKDQLLRRISEIREFK